jgi:hypothetical protein
MFQYLPDNLVRGTSELEALLPVVNYEVVPIEDGDPFRGEKGKGCAEFSIIREVPCRVLVASKMAIECSTQKRPSVSTMQGRRRRYVL